jgi:hypothetical protein
VNPTWYSLPDFLIEKFPERREEIEAEYFEYLSVFANPYPHVFLGSILVPIILGTSEEATEGERARAGRILDEVLTSEDQDLAEAALTEVVENLATDEDTRERAWPHLGPTARDWIERIRNSRGGAA